MFGRQPSPLGKSFCKILFFSALFIALQPAFLVAQSEKVVEIIIRNGKFEFKENVLTPEQPVTLLIRNMDAITHGFTSPIFDEVPIKVEVGKVVTFGKGITGVHIKSGATVQIHFAPLRPGSFTFKCDLHPSIKGEMAMLTFGEV